MSGIEVDDKMTDRMFGGFIRTQRHYAGFGLGQLGYRAGMGAKRLEALERGNVRKGVRRGEVTRLAAALKLDEAELLARATGFIQ